MKQKIELHVKEDFEKIALGMPKLKAQHITPRLSYLARTETGDIVVKMQKNCRIIIKADGTWEQLK